ncbi:MAG TPA: hypothetical protein VNZ02_01110 [Steroidobacteraceae bacterium]|jgi:hypothetical protein|nr:hypothetical protein [Steroidobacteraceae bacterium]
MAPPAAAMAFASHSGWAAMVVLGKSAAGLEVLARSRIELIDTHDPDSKQPYHAVEMVCVEEAMGRLDGYMAVAKSMAHQAIHAERANLEKRGYRLIAVGILESAARKTSSLASILASHAAIHAADGDHFRNALAAAAEQDSLAVRRIKARALEDETAADLRQPVQKLRDTIAGLGRQVGAPWGADQKQAALLAWLMLSGRCP